MYDSLFDVQWHGALPIVGELYVEEVETYIFLRDLLLVSMHRFIVSEHT